MEVSVNNAVISHKTDVISFSCYSCAAKIFFCEAGCMLSVNFDLPRPSFR